MFWRGAGRSHRRRVVLVKVGGNIAYFCTALLLVIGLARGELAYAEAGLLTAGAFGITRLCQVDCFSWISQGARWIYRGLENCGIDRAFSIGSKAMALLFCF